MKELRSTCPINYGLEIFGDQWSLLIIRDLIFNNKNTYSDFVSSAESISTNILAKRLARLEEMEVIQKFRAPDNKKTIIYGLTTKGIELIPVLVELIIWGAYNGPKNSKLKAWADEMKKNKTRAIQKAKLESEKSLKSLLKA